MLTITFELFKYLESLKLNTIYRSLFSFLICKGGFVYKNMVKNLFKLIMRI